MVLPLPPGYSKGRSRGQPKWEIHRKRPRALWWAKEFLDLFKCSYCITLVGKGFIDFLFWLSNSTWIFFNMFNTLPLLCVKAASCNNTAFQSLSLRSTWSLRFMYLTLPKTTSTLHEYVRPVSQSVSEVRSSHWVLMKLSQFLSRAGLLLLPRCA